MLIEEIRGDAEAEIRVLIVDSDPKCIEIFETLLRTRHYNVTTTNQASVALKMIRENKDGLDLVISDVHMPDMDGFKLLELVNFKREDPPVIMMSVSSDPKHLMKVTNDLRKLWVEQLSDFWLYITSRKKFDSMNQNRSSDQTKAHHSIGEESTDQMGKLDSKRNDNEYEDNGAEHKFRTGWPIEVHRKFAEAAKQLGPGFYEASPKEILEMMNVQGITLECMANHLQMFKLALKRKFRNAYSPPSKF
ncbi:two-component response regulator ARR12-like isoform X2 [Salvia splendens]|uniref:two-component response regulator ARR12-like isoform X2 n=1 Tax=Salvia splendens TaxID=180675 RepID=UPI001C266FDB|nr:two-component response regulator ARR12-like isoform X2 [Salvia splendens]